MRRGKEGEVCINIYKDLSLPFKLSIGLFASTYEKLSIA